MWSFYLGEDAQWMGNATWTTRKRSFLVRIFFLLHQGNLSWPPVLFERAPNNCASSIQHALGGAGWDQYLASITHTGTQGQGPSCVEAHACLLEHSVVGRQTKVTFSCHSRLFPSKVKASQKGFTELLSNIRLEHS